MNRTEAKKEFDSYDTPGINLTYSHFLPIGTLKLSSTYLKNAYDEPETFLSTNKIRDDKSFVNSNYSLFLPKLIIIEDFG